MKQGTIVAIGILAVLLLIIVFSGSRQGDMFGMHGLWSNDRYSDRFDEDGRDGERMWNEYAEQRSEAFRTELESAIVAKIGQPIEGFMPPMLMEVFPGIHASDFDGVEASIGHYEYVNGELIHDLEEADLIHSAAESLTPAGYETLLANIAERLEVMMHEDVGDILLALSAGDTETQRPSVPNSNKDPDEPIACTMDAKQCPDGSYVGRSGPNCEFAACPGLKQEEKIVYCDEVRKDGVKQVCQLHNDEVCALVQVQCVTAPCDPVPETIMNGCIACYERDNVISYTSGACTF